MDRNEAGQPQPDTGPSLRESHQAQLAAELSDLHTMQEHPELNAEPGEALLAEAEEVYEESEADFESHRRVPTWLKEVAKDAGIYVAAGVTTLIARKYGFEPWGMFENPDFAGEWGTSMVAARHAWRKIHSVEG